MAKTVIFVFAGRRQNMALQLPMVSRILERNPEVEYHVWNLARNAEDAEYVRGIQGERITVFNDLYGQTPWRMFNEVYRYYRHEYWRGYLFVKIDDDVVFLETESFDTFVTHVEHNPGAIISAQVVNNGACVALDNGMQTAFESLDIPLLDVHLDENFAYQCHHQMFLRWKQLTGQRFRLVHTQDWLSINTIGYTYDMAVNLANGIGAPTPGFIAGRTFVEGTPIGDEGLVNMLPRMLAQGFVSCHLTFGPQEKSMPDETLAYLRKKYAEVGQQYLELHA
jgi:hypothetical protein